MKASRTKTTKSYNEMSDKELIASYRASAAFKKKNEDAKEFIKKHPIPKDLFQK